LVTEDLAEGRLSLGTKAFSDAVLSRL
jgi:hypothetical protein